MEQLWIGWEDRLTGWKRKEARYRRRKAERDAKRNAKLGVFDGFERVADAGNLYAAFKHSRRNAAWKESVQRYEAGALRNVAETRRKLLAGESVQNGFVGFTLRERGKTRHIKSVHISERVVQKCLCDNVLVPILSNPLIHDNGASVSIPRPEARGMLFFSGGQTQGFIETLRCESKARGFISLCAASPSIYRGNSFSNGGYTLLVDFRKFFDSIDHAVLFALLGRRIKDPRVRELVKNFVTVFGDGKSLGLGR
jgi:hypothetical protein